MNDSVAEPGSAGHLARPDDFLERDVDVLIVGAGPAGLAAAAELARIGAGHIEVLDREHQAGGIPRHSCHTGYGLRDLHRIMTGPAYARRNVGLATSAGAIVRTGVTVTGWAGPLSVDTTSPAGLERIRARAIVLATGARERPRSARLIPGGRPAGVYTTGQLQQAVYLHHQDVGRTAVVVGAEHVSFSAAVTLHHARTRVAAMITDLPRHQSYRAFRAGAALAYRFPVLTGTTVTRVLGRERVQGVEIRRPDGTTSAVECDTVVLTGDWIPDHELAQRRGLVMDPGTRGPAVDTALRTSESHIFAVGNLLHPVETADVAALDGRFAAWSVTRSLLGTESATPTVPVAVRAPLQWIAPNRINPAGGPPAGNRYILWSAAFVPRPRLTVTQGDRTLWSARSRRTLIPNRPLRLRADWTSAADPVRGPVVVHLS